MLMPMFSPGAKYRSNGDIFTDDCSSLTGWTDSSTGDGTASQTTFDSRSTFQLTATAFGSGDSGVLDRDVGTFADRTVATFVVYYDTIGTLAANNHSNFYIQRSGVSLFVNPASDGLYIYDGSSQNEVGTNVVTEDEWVEWTFDCDFSTPASATCDVYKNGSRIATAFDCSATGSYTEGNVRLSMHCVGQINNMYVDSVRIGSDLETY